MRIIEGKGPPSVDTFGTSNHLYKDTETGAFYRCHGNINEDRTLPYGPAHKHPGEQYLWTPTEGGGSADWNASEGEAGHVKNRTHYEHLKIIEEKSCLLTSSGQNKIRVNVGIKLKDQQFTLPENRYLYVYVDDLMCVMTSFRKSTSYTPVAFEGTDYGFRYKLVTNTDRVYYAIEVSEEDADLYGKTLRVALVEYELKVMDEKFIPSSIPKVQTAAVGQTVVVKAVDENGKPTEWEAADVGGGGGNKVVAHLTPNDDTGEFACDMSFEEMLAAKQSGKQVELNCFGETLNYESHNVSYVDEVKSSMSFSALQYRNGFSLYGTMFTIYDDGSVEYKHAFLEMQDDS